MSPDEALNEKVAKKILTETLRMKRGETLTIETWNNGLAFAQRLALEAKRMGVIPVIVFEDEQGYVDGVKVTPKEILGTMGKQEYGLLSGSDAYVFIPGPPIGAYSPRLTKQEHSDSTKYNTSWYEAAEKAKLRGARLPWGYVGKEYAKLYSKGPEEFARAQLKAALADFSQLSATGRAVGKVLLDGTKATLISPGARLELVLQGDAELEDGMVDQADVLGGYNMTFVPPGYFMKQVDTTSANGRVKLSPSMTRLGLLRDAELEFDGGRLTRWKSESAGKVLSQLVEAVPYENRTLSSIMVGLNPLMKYDFGQDRMVWGSLNLAGFGFAGVVRKGTLRAGDRIIVDKGSLSFP